MFRRLTSLLIVCLGLLSVIAPAMTCAAAASQGDCCPPEGEPPCGECPDKRAPAVPGQTHCVVSPAQVTAAVVISQATSEQGSYPTPVVIAAGKFPSSVGPRAEARYPPGSAALVARAAPAYLVTGRLRL